MSGILFCNTQNLDGLRSFYIDVLGCNMWIDQGDCIILRHGNLLLGFCRRADPDLQGLITFFYDSPAESERPGGDAGTVENPGRKQRTDRQGTAGRRHLRRSRKNTSDRTGWLHRRRLPDPGCMAFRPGNVLDRRHGPGYGQITPGNTPRPSCGDRDADWISPGTDDPRTTTAGNRLFPAMNPSVKIGPDKKNGRKGSSRPYGGVGSCDRIRYCSRKIPQSWDRSNPAL